MNVLDIIMVLILTLCVIRSLSRGFIKEIFSILGVIIGVLIASRYYCLLFPYFGRYISNQDYINLFGFTLVFLSVFLTVMLLGILLKALLKIMFIGWVDHTLGGIFGLLKGMIYVALLVWVLTTFLPKGSGLMEKSRLSPYITHISKTFAVMIPPELERVFNEKQQALKELWHGKAQKTRRKSELRSKNQYLTSLKNSPWEGAVAPAKARFLEARMAAKSEGDFLLVPTSTKVPTMFLTMCLKNPLASIERHMKSFCFFKFAP